MIRKSFLFQWLSVFVLGFFCFQTCFSSYAQAQSLTLPIASQINSVPHNPANLLMLQGLKLNPQDGLDLQFIVAGSDEPANDPKEPSGDAGFQSESLKLIKYFLTALAVPEKDLWVNLSPYEKDRITSDALSQTEMGRELLEQDYILKKITASLINPEDETGKEFWTKIHDRVYEVTGQTNIPVDTMHKIWIMPDSASVFAQNNTVVIVDSSMKVMLEEDYLGQAEYQKLNDLGAQDKNPAMAEDVKSIMRSVILPVIEDEVNHGKSFAPLRQIYHALILAKWFKDNLKQSLLGQVYANQSKIQGIDSNEKSNIESVYQSYLDAFNAGSEGILKEDYDPVTESVIARKYVTGGYTAEELEVSNAMLSVADIKNYLINVLGKRGFFVLKPEVSWEKKTRMISEVEKKIMLEILHFPYNIKNSNVFTVISFFYNEPGRDIDVYMQMAQKIVNHLDRKLGKKTGVVNKRYQDGSHFIEIIWESSGRNDYNNYVSEIRKFLGEGIGLVSLSRAPVTLEDILGTGAFLMFLENQPSEMDVAQKVGIIRYLVDDYHINQHMDTELFLSNPQDAYAEMVEIFEGEAGFDRVRSAMALGIDRKLMSLHPLTSQVYQMRSNGGDDSLARSIQKALVGFFKSLIDSAMMGKPTQEKIAVVWNVFLSFVRRVGGIDLDTTKMNFSSTGTIDNAVLQELPNIRPQDILGISIQGITVSPIMSLPKLLGLDDTNSDNDQLELAHKELSYLKED